VRLNENFLLKAQRRLETAKFAGKKNFVCSAVSNCYYALFNLMQAVVGEPPGGSWTHGGLPKAFTRVVFKERLLPKEAIKGIVKFSDKLYALRKEADYQESVLESSEEVRKEVANYISLVEELLNQLKRLNDAKNPE